MLFVALSQFLSYRNAHYVNNFMLKLANSQQQVSVHIRERGGGGAPVTTHRLDQAAPCTISLASST